MIPQDELGVQRCGQQSLAPQGQRQEADDARSNEHALWLGSQLELCRWSRVIERPGLSAFVVPLVLQRTSGLVLNPDTLRMDAIDFAFPASRTSDSCIETHVGVPMSFFRAVSVDTIEMDGLVTTHGAYSVEPLFECSKVHEPVYVMTKMIDTITTNAMIASASRCVPFTFGVVILLLHRSSRVTIVYTRI